jgi:hypothetical protein
VYVVDGLVRIANQNIEQYSMAVCVQGEQMTIEALEESHLMLLGGKSVGKRYIYWNFVASSEEKIEKAKADWAHGPGINRFPKIPGDDQEYIPLPADATQPPKGTVM